jgi:hypothetical protein
MHNLGLLALIGLALLLVYERSPLAQQAASQRRGCGAY